MLRVPGVTCHTGRVTIKERPLNTEEAFYEHMQMMRDGMGTAIDQIMTAGLDHLIMGIALESFWGGVAAADKLQADLAQRAGIGISMGSTASVAALNRFGRGRSRFSRRISRGAMRWSALISWKPASTWCAQGPEMRDAAPDRAGAVAGHPQRAARTGRRRYRCVLTLGPRCRGEVSAEAERWLGKPVLAVNVVSYWHAIRECGIEDRVLGHGRILEEF
jgi:Maleate cis-trans isomerase